MKLAVTGGTGFVGQALLDLALADGHEVAALARKPQKLRERVEWIAGDLSDAGALATLVHEADAVIHVAGVVNARDRDGFEQGNVVGTLNLLEAMNGAGNQRLAYVSSLSAREPGLSDYGGSKARAEKLVKASGLDWTIVRPPVIYGPRDTELLELFKVSRFGFVPMPKEGRASLIHVDDLARLLLALVPGGEQVTGRTFEPDDGRKNGWSHYELARAIGWAMGGRPRVIGLSPRIMQRAAKADRFVRRSRARLTPDRAAYFSHPDWVVSHGARPPHELWHPRIETREGLTATAQWYRENKWV